MVKVLSGLRGDAIPLDVSSALTDVDGCEEDPARAEALNANATAHLADTLASSAQLVYISTDQVYPDTAGTHREGGESPVNVYGWSKLAFDRRVIRAIHGREPRPPQWAGLRFFNVYGPNEYHKGRMQSVISQNYPRIAAGEEMRLFRSYRSDYADGGQLRDFIYVRDCVDVVLWLLSHTETSGIFNVGTGRARSWNDLAQALFAAAGREPRISYIPMPEDLQQRYQYFTEARMDRLRAAGYPHAFTSLEDGVAAYVQGFLASDDPYR